MAIKTFKSSDSNAPALNGAAGTLTDVLRACLVNGYGSAFASGTVTSNGTNVSNNDTVTINGQVYTFKTALTPALNEVLIGASAAASLTNLNNTINLAGTSGTTYATGQLANTGVWASSVTATVLTVKARKGGTAGNSIGLVKSAATLTVSGATLSGGSGSDTTTSAGWSEPYTGNAGQAVFRGGSGVQHYYHVDDATPNVTALGKEAQFRGSVAATAFQNWTEPFPTIVQFALAAGLVARKSATADTTARSWVMVADDRTCYLFMNSGDSANAYMSAWFGEVYSLLNSTDSYRSMVVGRIVANSALLTTTQDNASSYAAANTLQGGHYSPRAYNGSGTAVQMGKSSDGLLVNASGGTYILGGTGGFVGAEPVSAQLLLSPVKWSEPGASAAGGVRGRMRGFFNPLHSTGTFGDGDTITPAAGTYAGRTFLVVKSLIPITGSVAIDTTGPWETN